MVSFITSWRLAVSAVLVLLLAAAGVLGLAVRNNAGNGLRPPGLGLAKPVLAHGVVDQSHLFTAGALRGVGTFDKSVQPLGQEFTPSAPALVAVDVDLATINPGLGDDTITVNVRKGSIENPILATASQHVPDGFEGLRHFDFPSPLSVTPGNTYVLQLQATKLTHGWAGSASGVLYPRGRFIIYGKLWEDRDNFFQTYSVTAPKPEPTPIPPTPTPPVPQPAPTPTPLQTPIAVESTADEIAEDGACTLREAIINANNDDQSGSTDCPAGNGADTITLQASTYILTLAGTGEDAAATGDLDITGNLTITGNGQANSIIGSATEDGPFHVLSGSTVAISDLTIQQGDAAFNAGGILNAGVLTVTNVTVNGKGNPSVTGIINQGTLSLASSNVTNNANGGIFNTGAATITESTIANNEVAGGYAGIHNDGTLSVSKSVVSDNSAGEGVGGIGNSGTMTITSSTITHNDGYDTGGIDNSGTMELTDTTVSDNSGGGIWNRGGLTVLNSTVSNNEENANVEGAIGTAGGIANEGNLTLTNSTVSGNTNSPASAGGISNTAAGTASITNSTITSNTAGASAGGIDNAGVLELVNTIIAGNAAATRPDCSGQGTSLGHILIGDASECELQTASGDLIGTSSSPIDPLLGPLRNNGGATFTHELLPESPAIDAGDNASCPATDQRGVTRPQGTTCDIGAFEASPPRRQLIIFLQGILTDLSVAEANQGNIVGMGTVPEAVSDVFPEASNDPDASTRLLMYSYTGSRSAGGLPPGLPLDYNCRDTVTRSIIDDIQTLDEQIKNAIDVHPAGSEVDIYLIGHSLGGAVALAYLDFLQQGLEKNGNKIVSLPTNAHLKAVITLDSPLGGFGGIPKFIEDLIADTCQNLRDDDPRRSVRNLREVYDSLDATTLVEPDETIPRGAKASFLVLHDGTLPPVVPSNGDLTEAARIERGTSFLSIGNIHDLFLTRCFFPTDAATQFLKDEGDGKGLYGREFDGGRPRECGVNALRWGERAERSHTAVLENESVQDAVRNFLNPIADGAVGGTPNPLEINRYQTKP